MKSPIPPQTPCSIKHAMGDLKELLRAWPADHTNQDAGLHPLPSLLMFYALSAVRVSIILTVSHTAHLLSFFHIHIKFQAHLKISVLRHVSHNGL